MDYMTVLLKQGFDDEHALAMNRIWLVCGMTHIRMGRYDFPLRELEDV